MVDLQGFVIIRKAIPVELAQEASDAMEGLKARHEVEKFFEYDIPPSCQKISSEFIQRNKEKLEQFSPIPLPERPIYASMGRFRPIDSPNPNPRSVNTRAMFATIALTKLNRENGWYGLCEGTHLLSRDTPLSEVLARTKYEELEPGDAILWYSQLATIQTAGGGGKFETLVYKT